jgi:Ni/Co efflux regulator RcnB
MKRLVSALILSAAVAGAALTNAAPAAAQQMMEPGMGGVPTYDTWQAGWDHGQYDRHHVVLGRVASFSPYRLSIQRQNGNVQNVDLKRGTVIRPEGSTPSAGERVAMIGYYSNGTFIVSSLVLRQ